MAKSMTLWESTGSCCKAMNETSYFEPVDEDADDFEPEFYDSYVPGQGILISQSAPCRFVAQPDKDLCLKHQYHLDHGVKVTMATVDDK